MKIVDANVLLYAANVDCHHHVAANRWLDNALSGGEQIGFSPTVLLAFLRISTKSAIFENPLSLAQAFDVVDYWLRSPVATLVTPRVAHFTQLRELLISAPERRKSCQRCRFGRSRPDLRRTNHFF